MNLRAMEDSDFISIFDINQEVQLNPWTEAMLKEEMAVRNPFSAVLEDAVGLAVGYIFVRNVGHDREITSMGVLKKYQRKGCGRRLLQHVVSRCKENPTTENLLLEVAAGNTAAIGLYNSFGFEKGRLRHSYYADGSDALEMSLRLT